jgi:hypothetical protein
MENSIKNKFICEIIEIFIKEVSKEDVKTKLNAYVIEPSFTYIFEKLYPYILITTIVFFLLFFMAMVILYLLIRK